MQTYVYTTLILPLCIHLHNLRTVLLFPTINYRPYYRRPYSLLANRAVHMLLKPLRLTIEMIRMLAVRVVHLYLPIVKPFLTNDTALRLVLSILLEPVCIPVLDNCIF